MGYYVNSVLLLQALLSHKTSLKRRKILRLNEGFALFLYRKYHSFNRSQSVLKL